MQTSQHLSNGEGKEGKWSAPPNPSQGASYSKNILVKEESCRLPPNYDQGTEIPAQEGHRQEEEDNHALDRAI